MSELAELRAEINKQGKRFDVMSEQLAAISVALGELKLAVNRLPSELSSLIKKHVAQEFKSRPGLMARTYSWFMSILH